LNVPGCDPIRLVDLAEKMAALCPGSFQVIPFPEAHARIDIGDYYCTGSALRALAGWQPLVSLDEGLQRTLDYFR
jgi:nucleoside-diphosphate-sugar epimerase